jgi:hypothetical protein
MLENYLRLVYLKSYFRWNSEIRMYKTKESYQLITQKQWDGIRLNAPIKMWICLLCIFKWIPVENYVFMYVNYLTSQLKIFLKDASKKLK